ncbi:MAG: transcriptional regulator, partial [Acidobacteria bacterium RBG_16_64_8]
MDVPLLIKQRLDALGLEQRDLARAADVTESYISQLLTRRRMPPAPARTDIYDKMDKVLKLPRGELAALAAHQHKEQLKRVLGEEPVPLFGEVRELVLRKCHPGRRRAVRAIFERQPFGELERLVTNGILDVVKRTAKEQLENEPWLRTVAKLSGRSFRDIRVVALEFLDTDILHVSPENCVAFLDPLVESWDIDLPTFEVAIVLHPKVSARSVRVFRFTEQPPRESDDAREPGFGEFLANRLLSGSVTEEELEVLAGVRFTTGRHP